MSREGRLVPLPGAVAVLHRMSPTRAGVADSGITDRAGGYRLAVPAVPAVDTAERLVVAVRHAGVAYLSEPVAAGAGRVVLEPIVVYDTSSTAPVELAQRHLLVRAPLEDGSRPVIELLVLSNVGDHTRVGADSQRAAWETRLLLGALDVMGGESDLSHDAVHAHGDTLEVLAPIPPGERQVVLTYLVPAGRDLRLPLEQPVRELGLMLADTTAVVEGPVRARGVMSFEGTRYLRLDGTDLPAGSRLGVRLPRAPLAPADFWWVVVLAAGLALAGGFAHWRRTRRRPAGWTEAELLAAEAAVLDRRPDPQAGGAARREALRVRLAQALANRNAES